jgi:hypothetical protein
MGVGGRAAAERDVPEPIGATSHGRILLYDR